MMSTNQCPRCGRPAIEHLSTHSYCWECNYSPDSDREFNSWRKLEFPYECSGKHIGHRNLGRTLLSDLRA